MHYQFSISHFAKIEPAITELKSLALHSFYTIEGPEIIIGAFGLLRRNPAKSTLIKTLPESIDWHAQWQTFAPDFDGNHAHFPVGNRSIKLLPGPGFGDLSHPTTQLMAEAMQSIALGDTILDIGCGSGVLSCIALHCNVKRFYIVDIDPAALTHAEQNMHLNAPHVKPVFSTIIDSNWKDIDTILINMILPEQQVVFESYPFLKNFTCTWLSGGLLTQQVKEFTALLNGTALNQWKRHDWVAVQLKS